MLFQHFLINTIKILSQFKMVLYAADLIDFEKPKPISEKTEKAEKVIKPKREMSEKQKASLAKAQETRKMKKEAAEQEKAETDELAKKLSEAALKKPRKRVKVEEPPKVEEKQEVLKIKIQKPKKTKAEPEPVEVEEPAAKKRKREAKPKSNEPPEWFKKYVEGVQKEKAASGGDVSKKQETIIKNEALKVAQKSWDSGFTRDRVENEVNSHMNRMYSMIFSR